MMISKAEDIEKYAYVDETAKKLIAALCGNDHYHFKETPTY